MAQCKIDITQVLTQRRYRSLSLTKYFVSLLCRICSQADSNFLIVGFILGHQFRAAQGVELWGGHARCQGVRCKQPVWVSNTHWQTRSNREYSRNVLTHLTMRQWQFSVVISRWHCGCWWPSTYPCWAISSHNDHSKSHFNLDFLFWF